MWSAAPKGSVHRGLVPLFLIEMHSHFNVSCLEDEAVNFPPGDAEVVWIFLKVIY